MKSKLFKVLEYVVGIPILLWVGISIIVVILLVAILALPLMLLQYIMEQNS